MHHPQNVPECSPCLNGPILKNLRKSLQPFYHNVALGHDAAPSWETVKKSYQTWNNLETYSLCRAWRIMKNSWKSINPVISCDQAVRLSVRPSVRLSVRLSHLFDHVPIIVSSWNFQELLSMTTVRTMQKVKVRGQRSRSQRSQPNLTVSGL